MLRSHTHHHHPVGGDLKQEIALYAQELKQASVFRPSTDPAQFADRVCVGRPRRVKALTQSRPGRQR